MLPLAFLITCLPLAQAMSWLYAPPSKKDGRAKFHEVEGKLSPEELAATLHGSNTIATYSSKPDCFRRAAALIQTRCDELETDEVERVRAALSMTLCEIATADHHSPPMECAAFQIDWDGSRLNHPAAPGKCVSALSRSAQYWSSYSGYLRDVSQLCFAFRRLNDIDTAKEMYRNATVEAITVLQYFAYREEKTQAAWNESITLLSTMRTMVDKMHIAIDVASSAAEDKLSLALNEMVAAFRGVVTEARERAMHEHARLLSQIDANTTQLVAQLDAATAGVAFNLERVVVARLDAVYSQAAHRLQNMNLLAKSVESKIVTFERDIKTLQRMTALLVTNVQRAGADMEVHLRDSHMAHEKQLETVKAAEHVSSALSELAVMVHTGMQDLNGTVAEIKGSFLRDAHSEWSTTLWSLFQGGLMHILKVQPEFFDHPLFYACCAIARALRTSAVFASSGVMSAIFLLASVRDLFSRRLRNSATLVDNSPVTFDVPQSQPRLFTALSRTQTSRLSQLHFGSGSGNDQSRGVSVLRRRTRLSRIPDRLCKSLL